MPAEPAPIPTEAFAALNAWVRSFDPSAEGLMLVYVSHGMKAKIPMPHVGGEEDADAQDDPSANLTVMESEILQLLRDVMKPGDQWTYDEIAQKSGYKNAGAFRAFIKAMAPALRISITNRGCKKT